MACLEFDVQVASFRLLDFLVPSVAKDPRRSHSEVALAAESAGGASVVGLLADENGGYRSTTPLIRYALSDSHCSTNTFEIAVAGMSIS